MEPIPSPDFNDVAAVRANGLATEEKSAPPLPDDSTILDSTRTIPMRDGHLTGAIVVSPKAIPANGSPLVVLYFGGGFMMGTPKQQLPLARVLAKRYDAVVLLPEYRLSPEYPFPKRSMMYGMLCSGQLLMPLS